eukprot:239165-Chlamydomonas_euryale.AAC.1
MKVSRGLGGGRREEGGFGGNLRRTATRSGCCPTERTRGEAHSPRRGALTQVWPPRRTQRHRRT